MGPPPASTGRMGLIIDNLLSPTDKCASSECLYELMFTTPPVCAIVYWAGAFVARLLAPNKKAEAESA
jgi:hypothetical protein